jgi:MFS family permease
MPAPSTDRPVGSLRLITVAGCLAMVYIACLQSPILTEFYRHLGAQEWHFGVLGALPFASYMMQFFGAAITNRLRRRRGLVMFLFIFGRLLHLPVAFAPVLFPNLAEAPMLALIFVLVALNNIVLNLGVPMWFSWMGDLIPKRIFGQYWGTRHQFMLATWTVSYLVITLIAYLTRDHAVSDVYQGLAAFGCAIGIVDILLFLKVREPDNRAAGDRPVIEALLEPLGSPGFRSVITYACAMHASAMFAASFMQLYLLKVIGVPVWQANIVFCTANLGAVFVSRMWGKVTDEHGHRPVFVICTACKPIIVIVFMLIMPGWTVWLLPVALFFDGMCNAGNLVALNSYMLREAPKENRSMFIAATLALTGLAAGCGSLVGGQFLTFTRDVSFALAGRDWSNYHLLFAVSALARVGCVVLARRIHEPESSRSVTVITYLRGVWPMRMLLHPVGLYRSLDAQPTDEQPPTEEPPAA